MSLPRDYMIVRYGDNLCCSRHINPELEIVCVKKGPFYIRYEDYEMVLNDNEATVILPYRIHGFSHDEGVDVKILMFSYSIAEDFYNNYRIMEMKRDRFTISPVLESYVNQELFSAAENKSVFAIKSIFFPLISEYLKDNESAECARTGGNEVRTIIDYISDKVTDGITADDVANATGIRKTKISRIFKDYLGVGFGDFIASVRVEKAYNMILGTDMNITDIAYQCGFGSLRHFNRVFIKMIGCTPRDLRKSGGNRLNIYK